MSSMLLYFHTVPFIGIYCDYTPNCVEEKQFRLNCLRTRPSEPMVLFIFYSDEYRANSHLDSSGTSQFERFSSYSKYHNSAKCEMKITGQGSLQLLICRRIGGIKQLIANKTI